MDLKNYLPKSSHNSSCDMTLSSTQQLGQTKIRYLGIEFIINQYVAWLDISMHHFWLNGLMQVGKTATSTPH